MKILYCADIHGDLESLKKFRDYAKSNADVAICAGDLISFTLTEKRMAQLGILTRSFLQLRSANHIQDSLEVMTQKITEMPEEKCPEELRRAAKRYSRLHNLSKGNAKQQYEAIKEIFDSFDLPVYTIPGNWDVKNLGDALHKEDLHDKNPSANTLNGITFGGYGGSYESMVGILPLDLEIPFNQKEVYKILCKQNPNIAVVHCPPFEILDRNYKKDMENEGSAMIRLYAAEKQPYLLLVGHMHADIGIENYMVRTVVINPGNLGRYPPGSKDPHFGTFMEIFTENPPYFKEANLRNISDQNKIIFSCVNTEKGVKRK